MTTQYAGFWRRFASLFIDVLILSIPQSFFGFLFGTAFVNRMASADLMRDMLGYEILSFGVALGIAWLYFAILESSKYQGTIGKLALSILVTDAAGNPLTFGRASGRFFGKILSSLLFGFGYVMAGLTPRKQALHDMLARTLVLKRNPTTALCAKPPSDIAPLMTLPPSHHIHILPPIIAWVRNNVLLACAIGTCCVGLLLFGIKYTYDNVIWTTVNYGERESFTITYDAPDGKYVYTYINKIRYREGGKMFVWHYDFSRKPEAILTGISNVQVFENNYYGSWGPCPFRQPFNLTKQEMRQR